MFTCGCSQKEIKVDKVEKLSKFKNYNFQNNNISYDFDIENQEISIIDSRTGKIWHTMLSDEYYGQVVDKLNDQSDRSMLFSVTYFNSLNNVCVCNNNSTDMNIEYEKNGNTIVAKSEIENVGISFNVIFSFEGDTLTVNIPSKSIKESKDCKIITIEILPFLGSSISTEDGYIFYPDGCGALYDFENKEEGSSPVAYKRQVYGDAFYKYDEYIQDFETGIKAVSLPVFGIKNGNSAILGVITKGKADSTIALYPFGYVYDAARVSVIYNYRYLYEMETMTGEETVITAEKNRSQSDFEIQYSFLANEDSDYSGMARSYRKMLKDNNMLNDSKTNISLSLDYLLSLKKPVLFWSQNVAASTFKDAENLLSSLKDEKIDSVKLNLLGWQSNGYNVYPSHFPISKASGGAKEFTNLLKHAKKTNSLVSISDNFFLAQSTMSGYSKRNDLAYSLKNSVFSGSDDTEYLMNVKSSRKIFVNEWIPKALSYDIDSVNLDDIARIFYSNSSKKDSIRREETEEILSSMLHTAKNNFKEVSVSGGNLYGLKYADVLYDIPESSSGDFIFNMDVPFFQIVVHGSIPYTPEIPGNFSNNYQSTILKWIEYGFVPYYSVSQSNATALKDCYNQGVLVSRFDDIKNKILDTYKEYSPLLSELSELTIYSHTVKENGIIEIKYENGKTILVNPTNSDVSEEGITLSAYSYEVVN